MCDLGNIEIRVSGLVSGKFLGRSSAFCNVLIRVADFWKVRRYRRLDLIRRAEYPEGVALSRSAEVGGLSQTGGKQSPGQIARDVLTAGRDLNRRGHRYDQTV